MRVLLVAVVALLLSCSKQPEPTRKVAPSPVSREPIKLGQIMPYSGAAAAYGTIGKLHAAFFRKLNREGGIHGRQVELISLDDGYDPHLALEQTRKLVEQERVIAMFNPLGSASNSAIQKYLNQHHVAQLLVASGAAKWNDRKHFPYTIGFNPSYQLEGATYAAHVLKMNRDARIAVLYQNDDFGKDTLAGFRQALGERVMQVVSQAMYDVTDQDLDAPLDKLRTSKADVLLDISTPKFARITLQKLVEFHWKPQHYLANSSASLSVLEPAGLDASKGVWSTGYLKDPSDPRWRDDPAMRAWRAFMQSEYPEGKLDDSANVYAYVVAQTLVQVLTQCGDEISADALITQAANLHDFTPGLLLPGVSIDTSQHDFVLFNKLEMIRFDGKTWVGTN